MVRFEALEQRLALSLGAGAQELYYPEGFANARTAETVSINNPGMTGVEYELWVRYETGARDQIIASGSLSPGGWTDVIVSDPANPAAIRVRPDTPFALVLKSSGQLTAALMHGDSSAKGGEAFVANVSNDWSLANVTSNGFTTRDFILFYNPRSEPVRVLTEFYKDGQLAYSVANTLDNLRRGGLAVNKLNLPLGQYSVRITSSQVIVVGHSHYDLEQRIASINIATLGRGALAGAVLSGEFDDRDVPGIQAHEDTLVAVFNPHDTEAVVNFRFIVRDGSGFTLPNLAFNIPAMGRRWVSMRDLGIADHETSIIWESDIRVTVVSFSRRASAYNVTPSATVAATEWNFASAFVNKVNSSIMNTEDVLAFNPGAEDVTVTFTFTFRDGRTSTVTRTIGPYAVADVDTDMPVQGIGAGHPFTVRVVSTGPIVAALEHWNHRRTSGHYASQGIPGGTITPLSDILVFPNS